MSDWQSPCGGHRWRTLSNGLIEVEGEGTPAYQPGSAQFRNLSQTWVNWRPLFRAAAKRHGVPLSWMAAIASVETGAWSNNPAQQASIVSSAAAVGIMQVIPRFQGMTTAQLQTPSVNVDTGAKILNQLATRFGHELPAVAASYNAGSVYCDTGRNEWNLRADANYPRQALMYNNSALQFLDLGSSTLAWMFSGVAVSGIVAAGYLWWQARH